MDLQKYITQARAVLDQTKITAGAIVGILRESVGLVVMLFRELRGLLPKRKPKPEPVIEETPISKEVNHGNNQDVH